MTSIIAREVGLETERRMTRKLLGKDKLTFSVTFELYCEMEKDVSGSFLELDEWRKLRD